MGIEALAIANSSIMRAVADAMEVGAARDASVLEDNGASWGQKNWRKEELMMEEEEKKVVVQQQQQEESSGRMVMVQQGGGGGPGRRKRRFAILLAGHASEYVRERYDGVASLFKRLLGEAGETWDTFSVIDGHFPDDDDELEEQEKEKNSKQQAAMDKYDGFVITGSRHDAHGSEPWVLRLCAFIQRAHKQKKKLLGICFGHQVISRALGGRTGRAANGWECGLKKIELSTEAMRSKRYWKGRTLPASLSIIEVHQDEVWEVPPGGQILAWSEKTKVEVMGIGEEVLGIQGHPEFTHDITIDILTSSRYAGLVPVDIRNQAMLSFKHGRADQEIFQQLCKSFLKDGLPIQRNHDVAPQLQSDDAIDCAIPNI